MISIESTFLGTPKDTLYTVINIYSFILIHHRTVPILRVLYCVVLGYCSQYCLFPRVYSLSLFTNSANLNHDDSNASTNISIIHIR